MLLNWKGPDLTTYGELVLEGTFKVHRAKNERTLFLFDRMLLITKRRGEHYVYKTHISVRNFKLIHEHCLVVQGLVFRQVRGGLSAQVIKLRLKRPLVGPLPARRAKCYHEDSVRIVSELLMTEHPQ